MPTYLRPFVLAVVTMVILNACGGGGGGSSGQASTAKSFTISGTVSGYYAGNTPLVLELNSGGSTLARISANGSFTFSAPVVVNGNFMVTVGQQPTNEICTVSNGVSNNITANVQNVRVVCSVISVLLGGSVSGLPAGAQVTLLNNGADPLTVTEPLDPGSTPYTYSFPTPIAVGSGYNVTVKTQPLGLSCTVPNGTATDVVIPVTNVQVKCGPATETVLYSFSGGTGGNKPAGPLTLGSDGNFYGTTVEGGPGGSGNFFKLTPAGVYTNLYLFGGTNDGVGPNGGLILGPNGNFYGVTMQGGTNGQGTVFEITPDGTTETVLHSFGATNDGVSPQSALTLGTDGYFYGTTYGGSGTAAGGTVFRILPDGTGYSIVHSFNVAGDGTGPGSSLVFGPNGSLYGTTRTGGANSSGIFFSLTTSGTETIIYSFPSGFGTPGQLTLATDGVFYGVSTSGTGQYTNGAIYSFSTSGSFNLLHAFTGGPSDGRNPSGTLNLDANDNIYGVTNQGGSTNSGVIYNITVAHFGSGTDTTILASGETVLYSFAGGSDASEDFYGMILGADGYLYGATFGGGTSGDGAIFKY